MREDIERNMDNLYFLPAHSDFMMSGVRIRSRNANQMDDVISPTRHMDVCALALHASSSSMAEICSPERRNKRRICDVCPVMKCRRASPERSSRGEFGPRGSSRSCCCLANFHVVLQRGNVIMRIEVIRPSRGVTY